MNNDVLNRLEQRVAKLEVANRRWRRFAVGSAIGFACLGLMAANQREVIKADQIEAQSIIVRDSEGHELITLGKIDNYPGMRIQFPGSRANATFFTSADHPTLALSDNNGASSITFNGGGAKSPPSIQVVRVTPGPKVERIFKVP